MADDQSSATPEVKPQEEGAVPPPTRKSHASFSAGEETANPRKSQVGDDAAAQRKADRAAKRKSKRATVRATGLLDPQLAAEFEAEQEALEEAVAQRKAERAAKRKSKQAVQEARKSIAQGALPKKSVLDFEVRAALAAPGTSLSEAAAELPDVAEQAESLRATLLEEEAHQREEEEAAAQRKVKRAARRKSKRPTEADRHLLEAERAVLNAELEGLPESAHRWSSQSDQLSDQHGQSQRRHDLSVVKEEPMEDMILKLESPEEMEAALSARFEKVTDETRKSLLPEPAHHHHHHHHNHHHHHHAETSHPETGPQRAAEPHSATEHWHVARDHRRSIVRANTVLGASNEVLEFSEVVRLAQLKGKSEDACDRIDTLCNSLSSQLRKGHDSSQNVKKPFLRARREFVNPLDLQLAYVEDQVNQATNRLRTSDSEENCINAIGRPFRYEFVKIQAPHEKEEPVHVEVQTTGAAHSYSPLDLANAFQNGLHQTALYCAEKGPTEMQLIDPLKVSGRSSMTDLPRSARGGAGGPGEGYQPCPSFDTVGLYSRYPDHQLESLRLENNYLRQLAGEQTQRNNLVDGYLASCSELPAPYGSPQLDVAQSLDGGTGLRSQEFDLARPQNNAPSSGSGTSKFSSNSMRKDSGKKPEMSESSRSSSLIELSAREKAQHVYDAYKTAEKERRCQTKSHLAGSCSMKHFGHKEPGAVHCVQGSKSRHAVDQERCSMKREWFNGGADEQGADERRVRHQQGPLKGNESARNGGPQTSSRSLKHARYPNQECRSKPPSGDFDQGYIRAVELVKFLEATSTPRTRAPKPAWRDVGGAGQPLGVSR